MQSKVQSKAGGTTAGAAAGGMQAMHGLQSMASTITSQFSYRQRNALEVDVPLVIKHDECNNTNTIASS